MERPAGTAHCSQVHAKHTVQDEGVEAAGRRWMCAKHKRSTHVVSDALVASDLRVVGVCLDGAQVHALGSRKVGALLEQEVGVVPQHRRVVRSRSQRLPVLALRLVGSAWLRLEQVSVVACERRSGWVGGVARARRKVSVAVLYKCRPAC